VADEQALLELQRVLAAALEEQGGESPDGERARLIGQLAAAAAADPDREISTALLLTMLRELLVAGNETTAKTIAQVVLLTDGREDVWERLRREPEHADAVAEEALRVTSPSLSAHRRVVADTELGGVPLPAGSTLVLSLVSANRDEAHFANADQFDLARDTSKSIAFGAGPHFCAGAAASRAMIADVALPSVFARLKGLRLDDTEPVRIGGWAFRGLLNLPARWDA